MRETVFLETMAPKIGPSVIQNMNNAQVFALRELLIKKGIFASEEMTAETEVQLDRIVDTISKMPVPSPIQPF